MNAALIVLALTAQQPQDTAVLKPVIVTATRVPVSADLVSSAVTVLRGADLVARGVRTVAEALQTVPGAHAVETGSYGGQTSLFMRGGESDYTKVLLDGVPLNLAGGGIDLAHLTLDNVDRIEIVRGPVSVLYGSDAMTGVVQIFTRSEGGATQLGAELHAGTYGATESALDVGGGTGKLSYSARVSRFTADGLYPYNNRYRNSVVSGRIRVTPDERTDASLTYRYGDDVYHIPTNGQGAPVDSNQRAAERGPLLSLSAGLLGNHLEARVHVAVREARQFYNDEPDSPGEDGAFWSRDYLRRSTTTALLTWRAQDRISVMSGMEYEDERQRGTSEFSDSFGTSPDSIAVQRNSRAYFTQAIIAGAHTAVTLGARLDDNSQFGTHGTYRAGVVYRLMDGTRFRFSMGTGFKEPSFFENYASGFFRGNPNLDPERSRSWEVGVERGAVAVTYFNQRFRDLIEFSFTPVGSDSVNYFNVGGAVATGIEASVNASLSTAVALSLNYTFLRTRVEQSGSTDPNGLFVPGKPLIRRPAHTLAPQLAATLGRRARVTLGARWVGKRDDVGAARVTLRPYARVNLSGEYALGRVALIGTVANALNDQSQEINGYRPRGRTVTFGGRLTVGR